MDKPLEKLSYQPKRHITDKFGFLPLSLLFIVLFCLPLLLGVFSTKPESKLNSVSTANESCTSCAPSDLPMLSVVYNIFSSTANASTHDKPLTETFITNTAIGILSSLSTGAPLIFLNYLMMKLSKIFLAVILVPDYTHHFKIFSAGKMTLSLTFLVILYYGKIKIRPTFHQYIWFFAVPDLTLLFMNILVYSVYPDIAQKNNFMSTVRYYMGHVYLILFQLLNYVTMLFLIIYVEIQLYDPLSIFFTIWTYFFIYLMHEYGKMVVILTKASHSLKHDEKGISLKTLLSSMIIIGRYHLGTITLIAPILRQFTTGYIDYFMVNKNYQLLCEVYYKKREKYVMQHIEMFTSIHGQDIAKAAKSLRYFKEKKQLVTNFENKPSVAWAGVLTGSLALLVLQIYSTLILATVEKIMAIVPILTFYVISIVIFFYAIVNTMTIVENTSQFCSIIKNEDMEKMRQEESQAKTTEGSKENAVKYDEDEFDEVQGNHVAENQKNLSILQNNSIV